MALKGVIDQIPSTAGVPDGYTLQVSSGLLVFGAGGGGTGNVVGPASATDNAIARFDLTTGKLIQNSTAILADNGYLGVNTTPSSLLHIAGTAPVLTIEGTVDDSEKISFVDDTLEQAYIRNNPANGVFEIQSVINEMVIGLGGSETVRIDTNNRVSIGTGGSLSSGTAVLDIGGATTAQASLRIRAGTAPTGGALLDGAIWNDSTAHHLYARLNGVTYQLDNDGATSSIATVSTTNNTQTTLYTMAIPAATTTSLEAVVVARRTSGASGTAEDAGRWRISAIYKSVAGVATIVGAITSLAADKDQAGFDATFTVSAGNVLVRVTGTTNNNINWKLSRLLTYQVS